MIEWIKTWFWVWLAWIAIGYFMGWMWGFGPLWYIATYLLAEKIIKAKRNNWEDD